MNRVVKIIITVCIIFLIIFLLKGVKNYRIHKILEADYEPKYYINELYKSKEIKRVKTIHRNDLSTF